MGAASIHPPPITTTTNGWPGNRSAAGACTWLLLILPGPPQIQSCQCDKINSTGFCRLVVGWFAVIGMFLFYYVVLVD